ncbi:glycoside hydrolase [Mycena rebaudengoi]|nr:glycoside hydrolase [Mycena rebaudengoi]
MRGSAILFLVSLAPLIASQQIWDIWETKWDRTSLFTRLPVSTPINFGTPSVIGSADIVVDDSTTFQTVWGFGGTLTDSSALTLSNLKTKNSDNYWDLLNYLFSPTDGANSAGLSYLRVSLGASDFSANLYSYDDTSGDTSFNSFNIGRAPSYVYNVIRDIQSVNSFLRVHILPWSPPGWMKTTGSMNGGSLQSQYVSIYASYLLKCLQGFRTQGITSLYAISIQNEPQNSQTTYPTTSMSVAVHAQVGLALRTLMNNNGFSAVKLIGYEHNWDNAGTYPVQLMQQAGSAFAGVAFHCYAGSVDQQDTFHNAFPNKEVYFTECSGTIGSDWWSDIKWYMDNLFTGALTHNAATALMWNIALNNGAPILPGTTSCGGSGCRSIAQVNSDGTYSLNQEFYAMAQASKAIIPKDPTSPFARRMGVSVGGTLNWALVVGAYVAERVPSTEWQRYSLVVLNWNDNSGGSWNPTPVQTTIEFRGQQATYTFPVGVTTLWWFAPENSFNATTNSTSQIYVNTDGKQQRLGMFM